MNNLGLLILVSCFVYISSSFGQASPVSINEGYPIATWGENSRFKRHKEYVIKPYTIDITRKLMEKHRKIIKEDTYVYVYKHNHEYWRDVIEKVLSEERRAALKDTFKSAEEKGYINEERKHFVEALINDPKSFPDFVWNGELMHELIYEHAKVSPNMLLKIEHSVEKDGRIVDVNDPIANLKTGVIQLIRSVMNQELTSTKFEEIYNAPDARGYTDCLLQKKKLELGCYAEVRKDRNITVGAGVKFSMFCVSKVHVEPPTPPAPVVITNDLEIFIKLRQGIWDHIASLVKYNSPELPVNQICTDKLLCTHRNSPEDQFENFKIMLGEVIAKPDGGKHFIRNITNPWLKHAMDHITSQEKKLEEFINKRKEELEKSTFDMYGYEHGINDKLFESIAYTFNEDTKKKEGKSELKCTHGQCPMHGNVKIDFFVKYSLEIGERLNVENDESEKKLFNKYNFHETEKMREGINAHAIKTAEDFFNSLPEKDELHGPAMITLGCKTRFTEANAEFIQEYSLKCEADRYKLTPVLGTNWIEDTWNRSLYKKLNGEDFEKIFTHFNEMQSKMAVEKCTTCKSIINTSVSLKWHAPHAETITNEHCMKSAKMIFLKHGEEDYLTEINLLEGFKSYVREKKEAVEMGCRGEIHHHPDDKNYVLVVCCQT